MDSLPNLTEIVHNARRAATALEDTRGIDRSHALLRMAEALKRDQDNILEANTLDLEASREMAIPDLILDWLKLTPERLLGAARLLERLSELTDPTRQILHTPYQVEQGQTYCQLMPLGVIALIYEAFPELAAIAAGLCIRTGNSLILKGGSEASNSNRAIAETLQNAIASAGFPADCLGLIPADQGELTRELVTQDAWINLVIPYGRASLVQQVVRQATVPVLRTALGNCYLYWSPSGELETACWMILDSHQSEPDPVNAIEKVLIHRDFDEGALHVLWRNLREKGFHLRGDADLVMEYPDLVLAAEEDWGRPYLNRNIAFKIVDSLEEAIAWINCHSSGHADCLVTDSYPESRRFAQRINSATVYINTSPRFYRNPQRGSPIALGMSNQKGHRRGIITLESLTTLKYVVQGLGN